MRVCAFVLCHKLEKYLDRAVASVITQTRRPDRIVIVGTDCRAETYEAARRWDGDAEWIESASPLTCAQSKNFCIRNLRPKDDAFFILDADDWLMPMFVERCLGAMEGMGMDAVGCDYQVIGAHGSVTNSNNNNETWEKYWEKANPLPSCSIVRASVCDRILGYTEGIVFEDWAFWIAMRRAGMKLFRYPQILFNHCRHESNLTNGTDNKKGYEEIQCLLSSTTAMPSAPR